MLTAVIQTRMMLTRTKWMVRNTSTTKTILVSFPRPIPSHDPWCLMGHVGDEHMPSVLPGDLGWDSPVVVDQAHTGGHRHRHGGMRSPFPMVFNSRDHHLSGMFSGRPPGDLARARMPLRREFPRLSRSSLLMPMDQSSETSSVLGQVSSQIPPTTESIPCYAVGAAAPETRPLELWGSRISFGLACLEGCLATSWRARSQ